MSTPSLEQSARGGRATGATKARSKAATRKAASASWAQPTLDRATGTIHFPRAWLRRLGLDAKTDQHVPASVIVCS